MNVANAVPAASALGNSFAFVSALSDNRPLKTRLRTMFNAHVTSSFVTGVDGDSFKIIACASSSSLRCPSAARTTGAYCSILSSSSDHSERRSNDLGSCDVYA
eukprot:31093-Pelagococcus_subviridis.AAC.6